MDEPFAAVDAIVRASLQDEIARVHRELGTTIVFVTHDVDEALRLADRIVVMNAGRVVQAAPPAEHPGAPGRRRSCATSSASTRSRASRWNARSSSAPLASAAADGSPAVNVTYLATHLDRVGALLGQHVVLVARLARASRCSSRCRPAWSPRATRARAPRSSA